MSNVAPSDRCPNCGGVVVALSPSGVSMRCRSGHWFAASEALTRHQANGKREVRETTKLEEAAANAVTVLELVEHKPIADPQYVEVVRRLCESIGYGNVMATASRLWMDRGRPGEGKVAGPHHATVLKALQQLREALGR